MLWMIYLMAPHFIPLVLCLAHMMMKWLCSFKGRGVVCTSMDKAETTLMFMCPKLYVDRLLTDLETGATYQPATLSHSDLLHAHNGFCRHYGIPVDMTCQAMPHYVGTCKMHKDPPGMRFISSSNTSSMRSVSLMISKLLTQVLPGVDSLFAAVFQSVGIDAKWTQHSWILRNTAAAIPLINAWNAIYASHSASLPRLYTYDFERLYTNIPSGDMHAKIMQLIGKVFASHPQHASRCGTRRLQSGSQQHRCLHVIVIVMGPVMLASSSSMTSTQ